MFYEHIVKYYIYIYSSFFLTLKRSILLYKSDILWYTLFVIVDRCCRLLNIRIKINIEFHALS